MKNAQKIFRWLILGYFIAWLLAYAFCENLCQKWGWSSVDLTRAYLNGIMAFVILTATLIERYRLMNDAKNYDDFVSSNKLFAAFGMALVPFAAAMTDLSRAGSVESSTTFCLRVMVLMCLIEYCAFLIFTKKRGGKLFWNLNFVSVVVTFLIFYMTRDNNALYLINLYKSI